MNNQHSLFAPSSDAADASDESSDAESTGTWGRGSEASYEDSDEGEVDSLADEEYWEEDATADAWLARFLGGTSTLYPQLFLVNPHGGTVLTRSRSPNNISLLYLPPEIRNRIYKHYFDRYEEVKHLEEAYAPFRNREA